MKKPSPSKAWWHLAAGLLALLISLDSRAASIHTSQANLRDGPNKESRVITSLARGIKVSILQIEGNYSLVRIDKTGLTGWVYAPAQGWAVASPVETNIRVATAPPVSVAQPALPASETASPAKIINISPPPAVEPPPVQTGWHAPQTYTLNTTTPMTAGNIYLEMDAQEAVLLFRKDPFDTSSFPVSLRDGDKLLAGEIAVKGSFSRRYLKKSLLITLPKGQTWQGRRRISLNAMATDPTSARDWLTWDLARALGMTFPQANYQRLYINQRFVGLYLDIEWMDEELFRRVGLAGGEFYQPDDISFCGDFSAQNLSRTDVCWSRIFPRDGNFARLESLGKALNDTPVDQFDTWLNQHFDSQSVIDWLIINTLTQNGDTYNKNYFLHYFPADGKWRVIPWDYDLSWGRIADVALPFPQNIHNEFFQYVFPPVVGAENPLKTKTLKNPRLYARFQARLKELLTPGNTPASGWFAPVRFQQKLATIQALTQALDPLEQFPKSLNAAPAAYVESLAFFNEWRYHTLKSLLLEASPFDTPRWLPYTSYDPLTPITPDSHKQRRQQSMDLIANNTLTVAGEKTPFMEKLLAYPLAFATLQQSDTPVRLTIETDRESAPVARPPGKATNQCVERTWFASVKSEAPATLAFQFDYLQESSTRHELGAAVQDERSLVLWRHDGKSWQKTSAALNPIANYFTLDNQLLEPGVINRFVACME